MWASGQLSVLAADLGTFCFIVLVIVLVLSLLILSVLSGQRHGLFIPVYNVSAVRAVDTCMCVHIAWLAKAAAAFSAFKPAARIRLLAMHTWNVTFYLVYTVSIWCRFRHICGFEGCSGFQFGSSVRICVALRT